MIVRRLSAAAGIALLAAAALALRVPLDRAALRIESDEQLLYLPNGKHLRMMSFGHSGLMADAIYLWAIQYYANYDREDRQRYIEHVFSSVITELDPHYIDAYWLGALILIVEVDDLDAGLRLLEKGMRSNPDQWILPYLAGWESYHSRDFAAAKRYFEQAGRIDGAPAVVRRLEAGMFTKMGDYRTAMRHWQGILDSTEADDLSRAIARRQVRELKIRADVDLLRDAVERFRIDNRRAPGGLADLVRRGYLDGLPLDPDGQPYRYDPRDGAVATQAGRILGES